jgi:hypothetical protein
MLRLRDRCGPFPKKLRHFSLKSVWTDPLEEEKYFDFGTGVNRTRRGKAIRLWSRCGADPKDEANVLRLGDRCEPAPKR